MSEIIKIQIFCKYKKYQNDFFDGTTIFTLRLMSEKLSVSLFVIFVPVDYFFLDWQKFVLPLENAFFYLRCERLIVVC